MVDDNAVLIGGSRRTLHMCTLLRSLLRCYSLEFLEKDCTPWELLILFGNRLEDKKKTAGLCKDYVIVFINKFIPL